MIEVEYHETTSEENADGSAPQPIEPPASTGPGWQLSETLRVGRLIIFRWKRGTQRVVKCASCGLQARCGQPPALPPQWLYLLGVRLYVCSERCATLQRSKKVC